MSVGSFAVTRIGSPANVLREYTTGGSWSKPTAASFKGVWVFAAGGGGSGAAGTVIITGYGGGGGGGGAIVRLWIPAASLGLTETYAIGAGGAGVATGNGGAGGSTLFGAHVDAKGGGGGSITGANPPQVAGGSALLCVPSGTGASISGAPGGRGRREPGSGVNPGDGIVGSLIALGGVAGLQPVATGGAGGGSGGGYSNTTGTGLGGSNGGGIYAGTLTTGGAGGAFGGGNGTAGANDVNLDGLLGFAAATIGLGTGGGGGGGNSGATAGGTGAAGGRAAGGGGGGTTQIGGTRGASGAGGNGFLLVYEVFSSNPSNVFLHFLFATGDDTSLTHIVDAGSAGTYTAIANDGSSGTITVSVNGGAFGAFVSPTTLVATDTIAVKRTTFSAAGWVKLTGTY